MGFGKTLETISFLGWIMYERHVPGQFLIVVPVSAVAAWVRGVITWLSSMKMVFATQETLRRDE
jgi:SNF2 family DNA or RNA helicase